MFERIDLLAELIATIREINTNKDGATKTIEEMAQKATEMAVQRKQHDEALVASQNERKALQADYVALQDLRASLSIKELELDQKAQALNTTNQELAKRQNELKSREEAVAKLEAALAISLQKAEDTRVQTEAALNEAVVAKNEAKEKLAQMKKVIG